MLRLSPAVAGRKLRWVSHRVEIACPPTPYASYDVDGDGFVVVDKAMRLAPEQGLGHIFAGGDLVMAGRPSYNERTAAMGEDDGFEEMMRGSRKRKESPGGRPALSAKRQAKENKYGRKKFQKKTDLNDFRDFNPQAGKSRQRGGSGGRGKGKKGGGNRPGKEARAAKRASLSKRS